METSTPRRGDAASASSSSPYVSMSPSPSHTPRSSSSSSAAKPKPPRNHMHRGPLLLNNSQDSNKPDKGVNIQVLLRCRPLSEEERRLNTPVVITCNDQRREVSVAQNIANKQIDRTFVFDKVLGPKSRQQDVFNHAVVPLVNEVLDGYNCTIFAYGQTGTGKTYTMEGGGGGKAQNGELPSDAGVIPRAVKRIFDILEAQSAEYSMKVSFLELYNEELTDLLAPEESKSSDDKSKKPMALMEDGKGGVFVRGLEEEVVSSAGEIYKILERGSAKRKTAETLLNKQSSRSHSIFSITIHIKECTPEGEEMIKCGKLNLVDLAGSENISRSGARDGRAREAGEINKSLLTLGRVINTLVEHSGHIPYRDSKLTRLLRDSLGGKTKTCIIATIAPSVHCLEETLSTLDYAHRAKHIKNKPEVNQKMMKSALIKDLYLEMDRLKQELYAAREKNGVYIPREQYLADEAEKKALSEKLDRLELVLESKDTQLDELQGLYESQKASSADLSDKLQKLQKKMHETESTLVDLEERYMLANDTIKEKQYLIENLLKSEKVLVGEAQALRSELENTAGDLSGLFSKLERKDKIEDANKSIVQQFHSQLTQDMSLLHRTVSTSVSQQESQLKSLEEEMESFVSSKGKVAGGLQEHVRELKESFNSRIAELHGYANELKVKSQLSFEKLNSQAITHTSGLEDCLKGLLVDADQLLIELQNGLSQQEVNFATFVEHQHEGLSRNLERTKSVSATTMTFFRTIDAHALELTKILEESQMAHQKQLFQLQRKFEVFAADEEKYLMEKVAGLLAESNARKKNMVRDDICSLDKTAFEHSNNLQAETSKLHDFSSSMREQWESYMERSEEAFCQNVSSIEQKRCFLAENLQQCKTRAESCSEQWISAQNSVLALGRSNAEAMASVISDGNEASNQLHTRFSSAVTAGFEDNDVSCKSLLCSMEDSLKLDHGNYKNVNSMIIASRAELQHLQRGHHEKITEISGNADRSLGDDYKVDEATCSTPRRREINIPSRQSIGELVTRVEDVVKSFWDSTTPTKLVGNGNGKQHLAASTLETQSQRAPLATIN
ncbi:kinesin-like protein KIN-5A [Phragmites australis]|uniref:kinesin-like protein KIN-5A n=1 Tax=Phragmites australis TaxID=29695 RepID=UPI002D779839|nr:kinesin-like protein KIN-5A [Phragmites australis]